MFKGLGVVRELNYFEIENKYKGGFLGMKVLIACGRGMKAISTEMNRRFKNGTIKFEYVRRMEEVNQILKSELGIERVIITGESFAEGRVVEEDKLREQLIELSDTLSNYKTSVVFVISSDEIGPVIEEELFNYGDRVRIVKHSASYTVKLFERLTLTDITRIENTYESNVLTSVEDVSTVKVEDDKEDIFAQLGTLEEVSPQQEEVEVFEEEEDDFILPEDSEDRRSIQFKSQSEYGNIYTPTFESSAAPKQDVEDMQVFETDDILSGLEDEDFGLGEVEQEEVEEDEEEDFGTLVDDLDFEPMVYEDIEELEKAPQELDEQETLEETEPLEEVEEPQEEIEEVVENEPNSHSEENLNRGIGDIGDMDKNETTDVFGVFNDDMYSQGSYDEPEEEVEEEVEEEEVESEPEPELPQVPKAPQTQAIQVNEPKKGKFLSKLFGGKGKGKGKEVGNTVGNGLGVGKKGSQDNVNYADGNSVIASRGLEVEDGGNFNDSLYNRTEGTDLDIRANMTQKELEEITELLNKLSNRHANYVFTGTRGAGATSIAYNVSALLCNLGFSILYVDCDTNYRPLSYMTYDLFTMVHVNDETSESYVKAVGSPLNIENHAHIVMPGFHAITMGLEQDTTNIPQIVDKQKFRRFSGMVRDRYDFVIYDMPFEFLLTTGIETAFVADSIVTVVDANTKGLMELLVKFGNIENEDTRMLLFSKASILMNKYRKETLYFGKHFKKQESLLEQLDNIGEEVTGAEADFRFVNMKCLGVFPFVNEMDNCWFTNNIPIANKAINQQMLSVVRAMLGGE